MAMPMGAMHAMGGALPSLPSAPPATGAPPARSAGCLRQADGHAGDARRAAAPDGGHAAAAGAGWSTPAAALRTHARQMMAKGAPPPMDEDASYSVYSLAAPGDKHDTESPACEPLRRSGDGDPLATGCVGSLGERRCRRSEQVDGGATPSEALHALLRLDINAFEPGLWRPNQKALDALLPALEGSARACAIRRRPRPRDAVAWLLATDGGRGRRFEAAAKSGRCVGRPHRRTKRPAPRSTASPSQPLLEYCSIPAAPPRTAKEFAGVGRAARRGCGI